MTDPVRSSSAPASAPLTIVTAALGALGLIPALVLLLLVGGVAFVGVRFLWQFAQLLAS